MTARAVRVAVLLLVPTLAPGSADLLPLPGSRAHGAASSGPASALAAQESHLVVVQGLGGTPEMEERFSRWAIRIVDAARERFGLAEESVVYLAPRPEKDPDRIADRSTRESVERVLDETAGRADPGDRVLVVLIGHGNWDGERSRFSMPGPDLTAADFAALLKPFEDQTVALVNAASSSGEFLPVLSGPRRIVVTATQSGRESNATEFGRFFSEALAGEGADADRDGSISLLEAFRYARTEVERHYEEQNLLLTEHARLDDDGDGEGTAAPQGGEGEGSLAARFVLSGGPNVEEGADPRLRALYDERRALEEEVRDLRARKDEMPDGAYQDSLERLLVKLARISREIRGLEGAEP